jgi:hypothetical protein
MCCEGKFRKKISDFTNPEKNRAYSIGTTIAEHFLRFTVGLISFKKSLCIFSPPKLLKEGPLTKNGPIDFAQNWAILTKKSN